MRGEDSFLPGSSSTTGGLVTCLIWSNSSGFFYLTVHSGSCNYSKNLLVGLILSYFVSIYFFEMWWLIDSATGFRGRGPGFVSYITR